MFLDRARRARLLAERYSAAHEILTFYAALAEWQSQVIAPDLRTLRDFFPSLLNLVKSRAPFTLAEAARRIEPSSFERIVGDYWDAAGDFSMMQFFARALLQPYASSLPDGLDCPWCRRPPQVGCMQPQAEGLAFAIVCPLCMRRRPFERGRCPGCSENAENKLCSFTSTDFPNLRLQACDSCKGYLQVADLSRDPAAIPEVDELAGLPLDLWAQEHGYHKLQPNIVGI